MTAEDDACTCASRPPPFCLDCRLKLLWAFSAILYGLHEDLTHPRALPGRN